MSSVKSVRPRGRKRSRESTRAFLEWNPQVRSLLDTNPDKPLKESSRVEKLFRKHRGSKVSMGLYCEMAPKGR